MFSATGLSGTFIGTLSIFGVISTSKVPGTCLFQTFRFPKGSLIIREGDTLNGIFFLGSKGLIKCTVFMPSGREVTECFINKVGQPAIPEPNLFLGQEESSSRFDMQAMTDVELIFLPMEVLRELSVNYPQIVQIVIMCLQDALRYHIELQAIHCGMSAEEKYDWFVKNYPEIFDLVRLKDIASFLNITPVTLSRIRRKKKGIEGGRYSNHTGREK